MMRNLYRRLLRLHPAWFRDRFEQEMLCVYDEASRDGGELRLVGDGLLSLLRQWTLRPKQSPSPLQVAQDVPLFASLEDGQHRPMAMLFGGLCSLLLITGLIASFSLRGSRNLQVGGVFVGGGSGLTGIHVPASATETVASRQFLDWLQVYNTGDATVMRAYCSVHSPGRDIDPWMKEFEESGPLRVTTLQLIGRHGVVAVAETKNRGWRHVHLYVDLSDPPLIRDLRFTSAQ